MSRHTLDRPFDQERFNVLKYKARAVLGKLKRFRCGGGKIHDKNTLAGRLQNCADIIEKYGECYSYIYRPLGVSRKIFYTLDTLEEYIEKANRFLGR